MSNTKPKLLSEYRMNQCLWTLTDLGGNVTVKELRGHIAAQKEEIERLRGAIEDAVIRLGFASQDNQVAWDVRERIGAALKEGGAS